MQHDSILITLADDDEDDRLFFIDAFEELKINTVVNTVNNGRELLNYINDPETILPNIIFLDLNMPILNGIESLKEIKQNERFKDIVIAIYSTSSSDQDVEDTFVLGANIYIKKPSNFDSLKKVLSEIVTINWQYHTSGLNKDTFLLRL
ncbi:response regulator [Flavobacterium aquicola]|uniref:Response regulator receiver domain-containing protein n=1 Tax=Flavobacterium aquicola TaxID=1682742 RepID=A0A3E0EUX9_9FLAO|nr:response regulator [Flavobacterium aquicola]REH02025.1 response regulator receiver domain-containing protein [Flavobacterium aquicola]